MDARVLRSQETVGDRIGRLPYHVEIADGQWRINKISTNILDGLREQGLESAQENVSTLMHGRRWGDPCGSGSINHSESKGSAKSTRVFLGLRRFPCTVRILTDECVTRR